MLAVAVRFYWPRLYSQVLSHQLSKLEELVSETRGGWPRPLSLRALPTKWVPRSFAFFAKGRESEMPTPRGFHVSRTIPPGGHSYAQTATITLEPLYAPLDAHRDAAPGLTSANS